MIPPETQSDLPQSHTAGGTEAVAEVLQAQVSSLRTLLICTWLALIILSLGVNIFIWRQMSLVRQQLDENSRIVADYHRVTEPRIRELLGKLEIFAAANRDFQPIFSKYVPSRPQSTLPTPTKPVAPAKPAK